jgi:hypothetical protein
MGINAGFILLKRDIEILNGLAKTKMLTVDQIKRLHFESKGYGYTRMKQLERAGYVTSRPHVIVGVGRKKGTCYYLTKEGFALIGKQHYNPSRLIEPRKHDYREKVSELYVQLTPCGWEYTGSSEIKDNYNLNRNTKIACMLTRINPHIRKGEDRFAVYLLNKNPLEDTIVKIQSELTRNEKDINCAIVLHLGDERDVKYKTEKDKIVQWTEHLGMYRLHVMQYKKGIQLLKNMVDPDYILNPPFSTAIEEIGAKYLGPEYGLFSNHIVEYGGKTCHLTELVSNNLTDVYHLKKYSVKEAKTKKRPVVILVPANEIDYWRELFNKKTYPHFKFLPVDVDKIESSSSTELPN